MRLARFLLEDAAAGRAVRGRRQRHAPPAVRRLVPFGVALAAADGALAPRLRGAFARLLLVAHVAPAVGDARPLPPGRVGCSLLRLPEPHQKPSLSCTNFRPCRSCTVECAAALATASTTALSHTSRRRVRRVAPPPSGCPSPAPSSASSSASSTLQSTRMPPPSGPSSLRSSRSPTLASLHAAHRRTREAPPALAAAVAHAAQLGCAALRRLQHRQYVQLSALVVAYRQRAARVRCRRRRRARVGPPRQSRAFGRALARASRDAGLEPWSVPLGRSSSLCWPWGALRSAVPSSSCWLRITRAGRLCSSKPPQLLLRRRAHSRAPPRCFRRPPASAAP